MTDQFGRPVGIEMNGDSNVVREPDLAVVQGVGILMNGRGGSVIGGRIVVGDSPAPDYLSAPKPEPEAQPSFWTKAGTAVTGAFAYGVTRAVLDSAR